MLININKTDTVEQTQPDYNDYIEKRQQIIQTGEIVTYNSHHRSKSVAMKYNNNVRDHRREHKRKMKIDL
jgi:hypothetical protein